MIANYVKDNFDGMLVFGDVHGDFDSFKKAYAFAKGENFFFTSLGDLVDRGRQPYEVVDAMYKIMYDGLGGLVVGNHDDKYHRASKGNNVSFSRDAKQTLIDVGDDRKDEFFRMYCAMIEDTMLSGLIHKFDNIVLAHAATHTDVWDPAGKFGKAARAKALLGETNGERYDDGYPVRLYNWIDDIPIGKTVIVGHDKQPIYNLPINERMIVPGKKGGKAVFLDTGCGKGGFLSGAVILHNKKEFYIDNYMEFK